MAAIGANRSGTGSTPTGVGTPTSVGTPSGGNGPTSVGNGPTSVGTSASTYKISMYLKITDGNDTVGLYKPAATILGIKDMTLECFGEMRVDGKIIWQIKREDAENFKKQEGQTISIKPSADSGMLSGGNWVYSGDVMNISGVLRDDDKLLSDDLLYEWQMTLPLSKMVGKGDYTYSSSEGKTKAELHVIVTR